MASTSLERSLSLVFGHEGGFTAARADRGNWTTGRIGSGELKGTKYGISAMSYPKLDIRNLTLTHAAAIYRKDFAAPIRFDDLPAGVDHAVLDFAINSGPTRAIIALQRVAGVVDDGKLGEITLAAVKKMNPASVVTRLCADRLAFMRQISTWPTYGKGWTTRVKRVEKEALAMLSAPSPLRVDPPPIVSPAPVSPPPASRGLFYAFLQWLSKGARS